MATVISWLQYALIAILVFGETLFSFLRLPTDFLKSISENKYMYLMLVFFLGNMFKASCTQTGAFEIYIDNIVVFSKLAVG